ASRTIAGGNLEALSGERAAFLQPAFAVERGPRGAGANALLAAAPSELADRVSRRLSEPVLPPARRGKMLGSAAGSLHGTGPNECVVETDRGSKTRRRASSAGVGERQPQRPAAPRAYVP